MTLTRVFHRATAAFAALSTPLLSIVLLQAAVPAHAAGKPVVLEGELEVHIEDYPDGRSRTRHFLETGRGRYELRASHLPLISTGSRVRVRGDMEGSLLALDPTESGNVQLLAMAPSLTLGEQKVAVILVNFEDDASQPITPSAANTLVFTSVGGHYRESSFDQTWLSGDTFGYYTLPMSKAVCDVIKLYTEADKAVAATGGDLSGYTRKIYFFPRIDSCGWNGLATGGGTLTKAYINGEAAANLRVVGHELGHNYGLYHAHSLDCDLSPLGNACREATYGDAVDMMGGYRTGHFSAPAKEQLGWLNDGISPPIHTASASGRYTIEPYASGSVGAKAIKVPGGVDSLGQKRWYYLEYRKPIGFDGVLAGVGNLTNGVSVRLASEGDGNSIYQIDMHPGLSNTTDADMLDGALAVGETYVDSVANISFKLVSASDAAATIDVVVGGSPTPGCTRAAPVLSFSGPSIAAAGATTSYAISLINKDSNTCPATTFNLARSLPSGWTGNLSASTLSLSAGTSGDATLSVTSPAGTVAGSYGLGVGASSANGAVHTASASLAHVITAPLVLSASVGTDKSSYLRGETVYMSALIRSSGSPVNAVNVKFTVTIPGGSTVVLNALSGQDGYARGTYRLGKGKAAVGSYLVRADAASGGGSATASTGFSAR